MTTAYEFQWKIIEEYWGFVAAGIPITLSVSAGGILIGLILGIPIAIGRIRSFPFISTVLTAYVEVFRNTPLLVQIVWFYYVLPILIHTNLEPITAGIIAIGLNASAYLSEIFRAGILAIPIGQTEAARSLGMSYQQTMRYVLLPQAIRRTIPPFVNTFVVLIKESALVSYIGVLDVLHRGDVVQVATFRPLEVYTIVAVIYFSVISLMSILMREIERRTVIVE